MSASGRRTVILIGWTILALVAGCSSAWAQRYSFRTLSEAQGLTDLGVNTILQDKKGFIWVGGNNGLFRYDGSQFLRFGTESGLPADGVSALIETQNGTLWAATESGLSRRDGDRFQIAYLGGATPGRGPEAIAEDRARGGLYVATSNGLLRIAPGGAREWVSNTRDSPVWSVFTDRAGTTWYAQTAKICSVSSSAPSDNRCYGPESGVLPDTWGGLAVDGSGTIWARSADKLIALEAGGKAFRRRDSGLPYATGIGALSLDGHGGLLVPTGIGLAVPNGNRWTIIGRAEGLKVPTISWATADREGSIWIATRGGGVACWIGPGEWQNWTTAEGLKSDEVWAIARDHKQQLLVATTSGVSALKQGRFRSVVHIGRALSRDRVLALLVGSDDAIWIGSAPGGLFRYERTTGKLTHFTEADGIPPETVYSLAGAGAGDAIWAGGLHGVYRGARQNGRWVFHKETIGSGENAEYFDQVLMDREGRLWAAGSEGLACWRAGNWSRIVSHGAPVGRSSGSLAEAPDGAIWFAGRDSSDLLRITGDAPAWNVKGIDVSRTFGPQVTYFLGFDRLGNLWRGTGLGVDAYVGRHWVRYNEEDGVVWDDTDANAFFADSDNSVWIGTTGGLSHHLPASAALLANPAEIVSVRVGERVFDRSDERRFTGKEGPVTIHYSAFTYRHKKDLRFRYRLEGLDSGWTETSEAEARYSSLAPGAYRFTVESGTWNGPWSGRPATMDLIVEGPWWMSHWFAAGAAAIGLALIAFFWRTREGEHLRREGELAAAVRQRTEELERERSRERESNAILELILSNQPLDSALNAIGKLACGASGSSDFCVLLRRGEKDTVVSARGVRPSLWPALAISGVAPFEAWRNASLAGWGGETLWRRLSDTLEGQTRNYFMTRLIGSPAAPLGLLLVFADKHGHAPAEEHLAAAARLARIAIEHATMYDDLSRQARHDPLTGLPNRLQVEECLEMAMRECNAARGKLALLYVDLDHFKEINDTLSHRAGDLYLQTVAERMKRVVREGDIVGRIGGDEFNVIVPLIADCAAAGEIATRILGEIRRAVTIEGRDIHGAASVGIALYPDDAVEADELQRRADAAMYRAKTSGKDRLVAYSDCAEYPDGRLMDQEVRAALTERRFRVVYQPKVGVAGNLLGMEALLRMDHPVHGEVSPSAFIPSAERSGLIVPLGAWVLHEVCRQLAEWQARQFRVVTVAVNVSAIQISRDDFTETVRGALAAHGVEPNLIELELTESFLMDGSEGPKRRIEELRRMGIRFSLDDFGTGYSSLSYLHRLNIDAIKLDRSFVQSIETDPGARRIVHGMIGVAEGMGLGVIGEGVETEEQRRLLVEAGCEAMQGYLFAQPLPPARMEEWLRAADVEQPDLAQLERALSLAGAPVS